MKTMLEKGCAGKIVKVTAGIGLALVIIGLIVRFALFGTRSEGPAHAESASITYNRSGIITIKTEFSERFDIDAINGENIIVAPYGGEFIGETLVNEKHVTPLNLKTSSGGVVPHEKETLTM